MPAATETYAPLAGLTTRQRHRLRDRSKRVFGNADRLEVAYAIARSSGVVHGQELHIQTSISPPRVRTQLLAFKEAGLLRELPLERQVKNYERLDDPYWEAIAALVEAWMLDAS